MTYRSRDKDHAEAGLRRPTRSVRLPLVLTVACVMLACSAAKAPDKPESPRLSKTVIMVRHAEKSAYPEKDPELTAAGLRRAAALAEVLEGRGVDLVITSELRRSRETAADIATRSGLRPRVVPVNAPGGVDAHISEISRLVAQLDPGTTTLVVGHSFTLMPLLAAFGVSGEDGLCAETAYSKMWVVTIAENGSTTVTRGSYGAPDTPARAGGEQHRSSEEIR